MAKRCDQCVSVRITVGRVSRVCHEHGCPNATIDDAYETASGAIDLARKALDGPPAPRAEVIAGSIDADRAEDARIARALDALDNAPLAALDRADVERAIVTLRARAGYQYGYGASLARVADALAESLRARR